MKRLLVVLMLLLLTFEAGAKVPESKVKDLPQGVFKKSWNGNIIQYDANGKKTHTYKMKNGKIARIK